MGGTALDTSVSLVRQVSRLCQGFRLVSFELRKPHWYSDHCVAWLHNRDLSMSGCCSRGRTAWGRGGGQVHSPEGVWFLTLALCGAELWTSFAWQLRTNGPVSKLTFCFTMQLTVLAPNNGNDKWKIKCCTFLWEMQFLGKSGWDYPLMSIHVHHPWQREQVNIEIVWPGHISKCQKRRFPQTLLPCCLCCDLSCWGIHTERLCLQCASASLGWALCIATVLYLASGHNLAPSSSITLSWAYSANMQRLVECLLV